MTTRITMTLTDKQYDKAKTELTLLKAKDSKIKTPILDSVFDLPKLSEPSFFQKVLNFLKPNKIRFYSAYECVREVRFLLDNGYYNTTYALGSALFFMSDTPYFRKDWYVNKINAIYTQDKAVLSKEYLPWFQDLFKLPKLDSHERVSAVIEFLAKKEYDKKELKAYLFSLGFTRAVVDKLIHSKVICSRYRSVYDAVYIYFYKRGLIKCH